MNKTRIALRIITLFTFTLAISMMAHAQATRTWVSGVGDDANPCSRTAPCKTFAGAISKTAVAGEIDALDAGGFGTVTCVKSITIDGNGFGGGILASGTTGVTVNIAAGNAGDPERKVTLRRLQINGTGAISGGGARTGVRAINFISGLALYVENCYIQNFNLEGIRQAVGETSLLSVKDTNIQNCNVGIDASTTSGAALLVADRLRIERMSSNGINLGTHGFATIRDSFIIFNGGGGTGDGINMSASNTDGHVFIESTVINHNPTVGVRSGGGTSDVVLSNATIQSNGTALATGGGTLHSHGNNSIDGNIGVTPQPEGQQ